MMWSVIIDLSVRHVDLNLSFSDNYICGERKNIIMDLPLINYINALVITMDRFIGQLQLFFISCFEILCIQRLMSYWCRLF